MFDEAFGDFDGGSTRTWGPPLEIYETGDELVIVAELPGIEQKDINISYNNGQLIIFGERKVDEARGRSYHRNERWYGKFERSFQLPGPYNPEKIEAKLNSGILTVKLPKKETAKARQIPVSVG